MLLRVAVKRLLPTFESRLLVRRIVNWPLDALSRDPLTPPRWLRFIGGPDADRTNREFLGYFVSLAGLRSDHRVLDAGCGIGLAAIYLTKYLSGVGSYDGFDIIKPCIEWASSAITSRYPNFQFRHADIFSKHYNPHGKEHAESFRFSYPDARFDFILLRSVFTHLEPPAVKHYLAEIRRTLAPNGRAMVTAFLLNDESLPLVESGQSSIPLPVDMGGYRMLDPMFPETAVGLPEQGFTRWLADAKLQLESLHYGSWCGRPQFLAYQDIAVVK